MYGMMESDNKWLFKTEWQRKYLCDFLGRGVDITFVRLENHPTSVSILYPQVPKVTLGKPLTWTNPSEGNKSPLAYSLRTEVGGLKPAKSTRGSKFY